MQDQGNDTRPPSQAALISFDSANRLPIVTVARALSITVHGQAAKCWRHDDRHASVSLNRRSNRWKCFSCDSRSRSVVDFVMEKLNLSAIEAAQWLASHFSVEDLTPVFQPQRKILNIRRKGRRRISLDQIAKRGGLDSFSPVAVKVFVGLYNIARGGSFRLSLRDLALQVNLGKNVVHRAVQSFADHGILQIESSMSRTANFYVLRLEMLVADQIAKDVENRQSPGKTVKGFPRAPFPNPRRLTASSSLLDESGSCEALRSRAPTFTSTGRDSKVLMN